MAARGYMRGISSLGVEEASSIGALTPKLMAASAVPWQQPERVERSADRARPPAAGENALIPCRLRGSMIP